MNVININPGTKITIIPESEAATKDFSLKASFIRWLDTEHFFISTPLRDGAPFVFDANDKLSIFYGAFGTTYAIEAYAVGTVKNGFRNYVKIKVESSSRKFVQRAYTRFKADIEVKLSKYNQETKSGIEDESYLARTVDISNGGLAVTSNIMLETNEILVTTLVHPLYAAKSCSVKADVCWVREASRGSPYKKFFGLKFLYDTKAEYDKVSELISDIINIK